MNGVTPFGYVAFQPDIAAKLQDAASWVRDEAERMRGDAIQRMVGIGKRLLDCQAAIDRGQFLHWLDAEFQFSRATAYRWMAAATHLDESKFLTVRNLPEGVVHRLLARTTPDEVRKDVFARPKPIPASAAREIDNAIAEAAAAARKKAALAKEKPKERRLRERREDAHRKGFEEWSAGRTAKIAVAIEVVDFLREHLGSRFSQFLDLYRKTDPSSVDHALKAVQSEPGTG